MLVELSKGLSVNPEHVIALTKKGRSVSIKLTSGQEILWVAPDWTGEILNQKVKEYTDKLNESQILPTRY